MKFEPRLKLLILVLVLVGCQNQTTEEPQTVVEPAVSTSVATPSLPVPEVVQVTIEAVTEEVTEEQSAIAHGYTHLSADGNRFMAGRGQMPNTAFVDVQLQGTPLWLAAAPQGDDSVWLVVLASGRTQSFRLVGDTVTELPHSALPAGEGPPLLHINEIMTERLAPPKEASALTSPAILGASGQWAFITREGEVAIVAQSGEIEARLPVNALPDARLLSDEFGRLLLLAEPTDRYAHGVLGDALEAAAVVLIETRPIPRVRQVIAIDEPSVIEGVAPLWTDITGDGRREIIVTLSDANQGAQIVVFNEAGERIATGPAIGRGSRWRHQLAVAPFGPEGQVELVDVLTPHIGGVVEFYQLVGEELRIVARQPGFTSHIIGSRNLDMVAAGDFDGDGQIELLLPSQDRSLLGAIRRTADGAEVAWTVPIGGVLTTNLAATRLSDGRLLVGVGHGGDNLRIWGANN